MHTQRQTGRPRAFHPEYTDHAPRPAATPGWDVGLERQLGDGRSLARGFAWALMVAAAGVAVLGIVHAKRHGRLSTDNIDLRYIQ